MKKLAISRGWGVILTPNHDSWSQSQSEVAKHFNCNISNISQMLKKGTYGKRGKTRYYRFEYIKSKRVTTIENTSENDGSE